MIETKPIETMSSKQSVRPDGPVLELAKELQEEFSRTWWDCASSLPQLAAEATKLQKHERERQLDHLLDGLVYALKQSTANSSSRRALSEKIFSTANDFAVQQLGISQEQINLIRSYRFLELSAEFAEKARQFDTTISDEDIFQASRNVMTMHFIQMLLGIPVCLTPSIFAYSMLYPYTDNYLDNPAIPFQTKAAFNGIFRRRLYGEQMVPENNYERTIFNLVDMIESEFDREKYPQVYESLILIYEAQVRSLRLLRQHSSPYEVDVLGITFAKGGASVLADGYLVAGNVNRPQAKFLYGYGAFTQLMDDMEDIQNDLSQNQMTIFSQNARYWPLDALTNRTIHLGHKVIETMDCFTHQDAQTFRELLSRCIDPLLIDSVGQFKQYFTRQYTATLESSFPFHFAFMSRLRRKLSRQQISLVNLVRLFE